MVFALFKKDLILFSHDLRSVILTFLLPVILITLFAFAYGGIGAYLGRSEPVALLVADQDQSKSSREITSKLASLADIRISAADPLNARERVVKGHYAGALIIHRGFQDSLGAGRAMPVEVVYDRSREMEIGILQQHLIRTFMAATGEILLKKSIAKQLQEQFPSIAKSTWDAILKTAMADGAGAPAITWTSIVGEKNDAKLGLIQAVAGTAILMLLFGVAAVGTSLLEEKENGTINRLLISPVKASAILYGKMVFAFFLSILQLTAMFLFAWLAFSMDLAVNAPALVLMIIATAFAISSLGIFLAAIARTRQQAQNLSTMIILIMSALGGSMIPLFIMPSFLQKLAVLSVNYWGIQGFYDVFWRALPLAAILPKILILMGIGFVLALASIQLFKKRIMKSY